MNLTVVINIGRLASYTNQSIPLNINQTEQYPLYQMYDGKRNIFKKDYVSSPPSHTLIERIIVRLILTFTQRDDSQHQHKHRQSKTRSSHHEMCVFSSQCSNR